MAGNRARMRSQTRPVRRAAAKRPTAIVNLQDVEYQNHFNWMAYGGSGVGKTVLGGTAPNAIMFVCEPEGAASAKARGSQADALEVANWADFLEYTRWMEAEGHKLYEWAVPDGLTELEEHAWNAIMAGGRQARSVGGSFRARSRNDYPLVWDAIRRIVNRWNRMPINVLWTAQTMRLDSETEDGDDTTLLLPLVGSTKRGDTAMKICGSMTLVGLMRKHRNEDTGKVYRRLYTEDSDRWVAKDRHDTFGRYVSMPDVGEMQEAVRQRIATGQRPTRKRRAA